MNRGFRPACSDGNLLHLKSLNLNCTFGIRTLYSMHASNRRGTRALRRGIIYTLAAYM